MYHYAVNNNLQRYKWKIKNTEYIYISIFPHQEQRRKECKFYEVVLRMFYSILVYPCKFEVGIYVWIFSPKIYELFIIPDY